MEREGEQYGTTGMFKIKKRFKKRKKLTKVTSYKLPETIEKGSKSRKLPCTAKSIN